MVVLALALALALALGARRAGLVVLEVPAVCVAAAISTTGGGWRW